MFTTPTHAALLVRHGILRISVASGVDFAAPLDNTILTKHALACGTKSLAALDNITILITNDV